MAETSLTKTSLLSLADICACKGAALAAIDVAILNLACAAGLPGAEQLDVFRLLDWLDEAARRVDLETRRHWYRFNDSPATYNNSPGYFCCYYLLQVLQEDFGVRYNPARVRDASFQDPKCFDPDFRDSRDLFIHGIIDGPGGSCASMPVLYVAVGRRLGYPLKLVQARGHLFFRWDDPLGQRLGIPERFNVEGAGEGIASFPDDHYKTWPERWSEFETAIGCYLNSQSPAEELAGFLSTRAECLIDHGRIPEAIQAYQWAVALAPNDHRYHIQLQRLARRQYEAVAAIEEMAMLANVSGRQPQMRSHGDHCVCLDCSTARERAGKPPHNEYCQCFACRQAIDGTMQRTAPGHRQGCSCAICRPNPQLGAPWNQQRQIPRYGGPSHVLPSPGPFYLP